MLRVLLLLLLLLLLEKMVVSSSAIKLVSARDFRGSADTAAGKPPTLSQVIWRQLRSPFLLPCHGCAKCTEWEQIEYAKMGCLVCGSFHVCCVTTCPITEIENNHVCTITGAVVRTVTYDTTEYLTTATQGAAIPASPYDVKRTSTSASSGSNNTSAGGGGGGAGGLRVPSTAATATKTAAARAATTAARKRPAAAAAGGSTGGCGGGGGGGVTARHAKGVSLVPTKKLTVSRCINFHERVCMQVLCSETTQECYEKERIKLRNRLRWSFMRHVRAFKLRRHAEPPNCIVMLSRIAADIENYRLPIMNNTEGARKELAYSCAQDIFKFTCSMAQSNAVFTMNLDATTMVIGLLYLLRSGLVHKNMTVLPQYRSLAYLLPPENYINMFGVKSKIITECENIVKCHLRTLSDADIKDIGYEAFDRLLK